MISNRMYRLLSVLPRDNSFMPYQQMLRKAKLPNMEINLALAKHAFLVSRGHTLIEMYRSDVTWDKNSFSLSDEGLAEVELYEQQINNQKYVNRTLWVAIITLAVSVVSLAISIIDCLKH